MLVVSIAKHEETRNIAKKHGEEAQNGNSRENYTHIYIKPILLDIAKVTMLGVF